MQNPARIASIRDHGGELLGDAEPSGGLSQQQNAAVRGQASAIEGGCELLAPDGWKPERKRVKIGRGGLDGVTGVGVSTQSLSRINALRYARHPRSTVLVNKTG